MFEDKQVAALPSLRFGYDLPEQVTEMIQTLMIRQVRASESHNKWAEKAKICTDFFEGRQWTDEQMAQLAKDNRPILTINKIAPLVMLVAGYQANNRIDLDFMPTSDASGNEQTADVLQMLAKSISNTNMLKYTDSEVFLDGLVAGRGWWDMRLSFDQNDLGDIKIKDCDPFSVYVDSDADTYDLNDSAAFINETRWTSIDEIDHNYGPIIAERCRGLLTDSASSTGIYTYGYSEEISPIRRFAEVADEYNMTADDLYRSEFVDDQRKEVRLIDTQYKIRRMCNHFIDLETGDRAPIPEDWTEEKINKVLQYAKAKGSQMVVAPREHTRIRWSVLAGDCLIFDDWSPYEQYTKLPFFPYFRRGITKGIVDNLIDPQRELNKRRISLTEILTRNSSVGWSYKSDALTPTQKNNLRNNGARPGFNLEWKGDVEPKRIEPGGYPIGQDKLEEKNADDLKEISGINDSALGQMDRVQSGKAIEARQRQSVIALQPYLDNFTRSKVMQGYKFLELIQNHYTEERIFRTIGEDGKLATAVINQRNQTGIDGTSEILNDVTVGKYEVTVSETPMTATFENAQFEEAMEMLQKLGPVGGMLLQTSPEVIIGLSSLPQKDRWIQALKQAAQAQQMQEQQAAAQGGNASAPAEGSQGQVAAQGGASPAS